MTVAFRNSSNGYGWISRLLHWLIALHMLGLIAVGWWMVDLSYYSNWYHTAPTYHKAFGLIVFILGISMLIWHRISKKPDEMESHLRWEKTTSTIAHFLLITSVIVIPISGYVFTTSNGEAISFFGLFEIPALFKANGVVRDWAIKFHIYASYGILIVVAAHAGGAFKHHFIDRDRTLRRMTY